jgi:hypothetical protein
VTFSLTLLFMLLVFWRPQEWLVPWLYGWPLLDAIVGVSLVSLLLEMDNGRLQSPLRRPQFHILIGLWFATLMSHIANTYFAGLAGMYFDTFKFCLFSVLLVTVLDNTGKLRLVAAVFAGMGLTMAAHALMQERTGFGFAGQPPIYSWRPEVEGRVARSIFFGIFEDPNDLAQILSVSIPFAFAIPRRLAWYNIALPIAFAWVASRAVFSTWSRGGEMALYISLTLTAILIRPARWLPKVTMVLLPLSLAIFPFGAGMLDESARDRVVFWGEANWAFKSRLLFGVGYGMLGEHVHGGRAAHNAFVMCYTELGAIGYTFWFLLSFFAFAGAWHTQMRLTGRKDVESRWLRRFAGLTMAALASYFASSYFLSRAYVYPYFFLVAIGGSLPVVADKLTVADGLQPIWTPETIKKWVTWGTLGALGSIIYIYFSIILLNKAYGG